MGVATLGLVASELGEAEAVAAHVLDEDLVLEARELVLVAALAVALLELAEPGQHVVVAVLRHSLDLPFHVHLSSRSIIICCV